jgi:hypothetical protein
MVQSQRPLLMPRANGTIVPAPGPPAKIRLELGISVIEVVVVLVFAALFLLGAVSPSNPVDYILGAMFLVWVGMFALVLSRRKRGADRLVQVLCATCEATVRQE